MNTRALIGKLSATSLAAFEKAASLAVTQRHYAIEIEHLVLALLQEERTGVRSSLKKYGVNTDQLEGDILIRFESFEKGHTSAPSFSPNVVELIRKAWLLSSLEYGENEVVGIAVMVALFKDEAMNLQITSRLKAFSHFDDADYVRNGPNLIKLEQVTQVAAPSDNEDDDALMAPAPASKQALEAYTLDLTARARAGDLDPVVGRESEIRQLIDILCRRRQNNPILTGEAGVGKTAVVEGLAQRIVNAEVPDSLKEVDIHILDLTLLQAGAGVRGEFENRLKSVIDEVKQSPKPIILFIDEAHTLIGAGNSGGQGDAANILKPALARGELRTIAATTWAEYKKYFEKDAALTRRFQVVKVEEPEPEQAMRMLRTLQPAFEKHHQVLILDEAICDSVLLSKRYISGRQLPDVCVSVLDTACSRVNLELRNTPAALDDLQALEDQYQKQLSSAEREVALYGGDSQEIETLTEKLVLLSNERADIESRWEQEKQAVELVLELRTAISHGNQDDATREQLDEALARLKDIQGEAPLIRPHVDAQVVAEVISSWTGIPAGRMMSGEVQKVLNVQSELKKRIIGQDHALDAVSQSVRISSAKLKDPKQPIGVFMFCGSSGVGKTETALALADLLYGGEQNMTVINMSEFKEEHKVSLLMGSPPGYVGYGEGGVLTEAVRRKPYSVILLDEMEKAHPGVQDVFYQVFDKGAMKDGEGRDIDFRNTLIIMTTNAGTETISRVCSDPDTAPLPDQLESLVKDELLTYFKPAFLGRTRLVPFMPLHDEVMTGIVRLQLARVGQRLLDQYSAEFTYSDAVVDTIVARCKEVDTGARNAIHIINRSLLPEISMRILESMGDSHALASVHIDVDDNSEFSFNLSTDEQDAAHEK
ncbi:type VI secretion system ATPase TssH [Neptunomonas sp. CHC150]|uniref:type VI secretion system ATPase TssH n=1 Tax=Neptunomonas TaxID=75687 RepID=UPI0025AF1428|nr:MULTISPECIES: type VI secretion system ATPase TssH [Neptunomonas]MDN2660931.1 type VI secretion system ATPase TssH [Neptunomonas sp. CHC150]MDO6467422.1 type VI secretion system ATPase TssH [Neptunomonas phycophila]